jgi:hypothetical protein
VDQLSSNLKCAIRIAADEAAESQEATNQGKSLSVVSPLTSAVLDAEKLKFQKLVEKEIQRQHTPAKRRKTSETEQPTMMPSVGNPEDLIGKRVSHLCIDHGQTEAQWYPGVVVDLTVSIEGKYIYSILYDCSRHPYLFPLLDHLESGILKLLPVDSAYLVGKKIEHRFCSSASGEDYWGTGIVSSYVGEGKYVVNYDCLDVADEEDEGPAMFEDSLEAEYAAGDVRIRV